MTMIRTERRACQRELLLLSRRQLTNQHQPTAALLLLLSLLLAIVASSTSSRIVTTTPFFSSSLSSRKRRSHGTIARDEEPKAAAATLLLALRGGGGDGGSGVRNRKTIGIKNVNQNKEGKMTRTNNDDDQGASIATSVFNLANNVAGAGILTLSAGKASSGTGWIPSALIIVIIAAVSSHTFGLVGKSCELVASNGRSTEFKDLWTYAFGGSNAEKKSSKKTNTAWIVDSMVFVQCFFVSIIYGGLLGDVFSALLRGTLGIEKWYTTRSAIIVLVSTFVLLPLNLIKDLSALGFTSILGLTAVLYTVGFIIVRALDGTYSIGGIVDGGESTLPVGKFIQDLTSIAKVPAFERSSLWNVNVNALVLVSNLGLAFIAHYNGPNYWKSLKKSATSKKFCTISNLSYTILAILYVATMFAGYYTFGDSSMGNILLNYSSNDKLALFGRIATGFSIMFGFPLIAVGCREGIKNVSTALELNWLASRVNDPKNHFVLVSTLLCITTLLSIVAKDVGLVVGLTGALMGSSLVYICPPLLYTKIIQRKFGSNSKEYHNSKINLLFIPFGIFTGIVGILMTLKNA